MMRRSAGHYYDPLPASPDASEGIERENDELTEHLKDKIHILKSLSIDIGNEVNKQDRLLRDMDNEFENTSGFIGNTINRVIRLTKGKHNYYLCYLGAFAFFVFLGVYIVIKIKY